MASATLSKPNKSKAAVNGAAKAGLEYCPCRMPLPATWSCFPNRVSACRRSISRRYSGWGHIAARLRARGRKAFIPFLTAGDPDPDATVRLARTLAASGASLLELGFPYSDPIADGSQSRRG